MKNDVIRIGFSSANHVIEVDTAIGFLNFFGCIKKYITWDKNSTWEDLICNRLYKRYVKKDNLEATEFALNFIADKFKDIFNTKGESLFDIFRNYFESYSKSTNYSKMFLEKYNEYIPIIICTTSLPHCVIDTERSLEKYDTLDGPPFWTRFYLKELCDQGKDMPELPF